MREGGTENVGAVKINLMKSLRRRTAKSDWRGIFYFTCVPCELLFGKPCGRWFAFLFSHFCLFLCNDFNKSIQSLWLYVTVFSVTKVGLAVGSGFHGGGVWKNLRKHSEVAVRAFSHFVVVVVVQLSNVPVERITSVFRQVFFSCFRTCTYFLWSSPGRSLHWVGWVKPVKVVEDVPS